MKEEKTKSKKKVIYTIVLAAGVLLLAAATVLTVYFATQNDNVLVDKPPIVDPDAPSGPTDPDNPDQPSGPSEPDNPDQPSGPSQPDTPSDPSQPSGGSAVRFVSPIENAAAKVNYLDVYDNKTLGWGYFHKAVDYEAEEGTEVRAIGDGTVESVTCDEFTGNLIVIDHGDDLRSYYRFVEPMEGLHQGDTVKQGDVIGTVAAAYGIERFDGVHLHFEMHLGALPVNPADYLDLVLEEK